jgi:hypothetical protein
MPYIAEERRTAIREGAPPQNAGELNYLLTWVVDRFLRDRNGFRYADLNDAVGALECAKLELYRRVAAPYEDQKLAAEGDVYDAAVIRRARGST